jgi:predicted nucleic acid-binding protein
VAQFVQAIPPENAFLCAISVGEISSGLERLPDGRKRRELTEWLDTALLVQFNGRIVPLDFAVMREWGRMVTKARRTLPVLDSLIAAAALAHSLTLVTRNVSDFSGIDGVLMVNPWNYAPDVARKRGEESKK